MSAGAGRTAAPRPSRWPRLLAAALALAACGRLAQPARLRRRAGRAGGRGGRQRRARLPRRHHLRHLPGGGRPRRRHARDRRRPASAPPPRELARRNALPEDYHPAPRRGAAPARQRAAPAARRRRPRQRRGHHPAARLDLRQRPRRRRPAANPFQNGQTEPLIDPVRHRVEAGETAYSIARLYGVSVTALASWNGLGPDLAVRENQELLIPIVSDANRISSAADIDTQPGQGTPVAPPPSAAAPLPADITAAVEPDSPDLGQYRTPPGGRLGAAGHRQASPGAYNPATQRRRLRRPRRHPGQGRRPRRGGAGLRGARRPRHHRAGPAQGRPHHHLLDARRRAG